LADTVYEHQHETLNVTLSNPLNAELGKSEAIGTIFNDDAGGMNDTGITTSVSHHDDLMGEDADYGRDVSQATNSNVDGHVGFSFTKLDATGQPLLNQSVAYSIVPWSCVQDEVTGLVWEVKGEAGSDSLHDAEHTYTWHNASELEAKVNEEGLCGYINWRLPTLEELRSIVDYSIELPGPTIDTTYFPNTRSDLYWSDDTYVGAPYTAWLMSFRGAYDIANFQSLGYHVRLVSSGNGL